jgi:DNA replication protein DnaC
MSDLDRTRQLLRDLGFERVPEVLAELLEANVKSDGNRVELLESVLRTEREFREERRVRTSTRLSGLPAGRSLQSFDFGFQRGVDKGRIELLATAEFVARRENVLLLGPPGVGKTHLASGLGVKAIEAGFSVSFLSADGLIQQMLRDEQAQRPRQRKFMNIGLLIIDELGFQALDRRSAALLFRVISHRYEKGSVVITSNKSIREWPEMLAGDEVLATAILDRLLHHCHVVAIDGDSWRLRHLQEQLATSSSNG